MAKIKKQLLFVQIPADFTSDLCYRHLTRAAKKASIPLTEVFSIVIGLQMFSAQENGYFIKYSENLLEDLYDIFGVDTVVTQEIIKLGLEFGIFDPSLYNEGILTGQYIQDSYFSCYLRLRRALNLDDFPYLLPTIKRDYFSTESGDSSTESGHSFAESGHSSAESGHSSAESGHSSAESGHSSEESGHSSAESGHSSVESGHSSAESGHSSAESGHSSVVKKGINKEKQCINNEDLANMCFDFLPLQQEWQALVSSSIWRKKGRDAIAAAYRQLKSYSRNQFLPMLMIRNTLQHEYATVFSPNDSMIRDAEERLKEYNRCLQTQMKQSPANPELHHFTIQEIKAENAAPAVKLLNKCWQEACEKMPKEIKRMAEGASFGFDGTKLDVHARKEVNAWLKQNIADVTSPGILFSTFNDIDENGKRLSGDGCFV